MKRVSKWFYLGSIALGEGIPMLCFGLILTGVLSEDFAYYEFIYLRAASMLFTVLITTMLYHKMWSSIPVDQRRINPALAVGLLLVPLFNIYWIFRAIWGFSKNYNKYIQSNQLLVSQLSESVFLGYCLMYVITAIPILGLLFLPIRYLFMLMMVPEICDAINALADEPCTTKIADKPRSTRKSEATYKLFRCSCSTKLKIPSRLSGRATTCPKCKRQLKVPEFVTDVQQPDFADVDAILA